MTRPSRVSICNTYYWFMDNDTFEQMPIAADMVGAASDWLKENDDATLLYGSEEVPGG